jgi:hypothetical protein
MASSIGFGEDGDRYGLVLGGAVPQLEVQAEPGDCSDIVNNGHGLRGGAQVTPDDRAAVMSLVIVPGRGRKGSPEELLRHFGTDDGQALGLSLLRDAVDRQDGLDVEMALVVCAVFGFTTDHLDPLLKLASADWHHKHEDVVSALGRLQSPAAVDALYHAAWWIPGYLDFDENRALAVKAIWALGGTPGAEAEQALRQLLGTESEIVREAASAQLKRRKKA